MEMSLTGLHKPKRHVMEHAWVLCQGKPPHSPGSRSLLTVSSNKKGKILAVL